MSSANDETYNRLLAKHPQGRNYSHVPPAFNESFKVDESDVIRAIKSFPPGSAGGPDKLTPQVLKDLTSKATGERGTSLVRRLVAFVNMVAGGTVPEAIRPWFFGANLFSLAKKDGGVRPIAVGNTLRRLVSKCAGYAIKSARQERYGHKQLGYGVPKGAEAAAHAVRRLIQEDNPPDRVLVKIDFKNAFNMIDRNALLTTVHNHFQPIYNYTRAAYGSESLLFFEKFRIPSRVGVQQGDPEGPPLFSDVLQDLVDELLSKLNTWYLDDGNLSDSAEVVLRDLERIMAAASQLGLEVNPSKCELVFLGEPNPDLANSILGQFNNICPGIQVTRTEDLVILGAPVGIQATRQLLTEKDADVQRVCETVGKLDSHHAYYLLKNCLSIPKLLYFLRTAPCFREEGLLEQYDDTIINALSGICNVRFSEASAKQCFLPAALGGLGIQSAKTIALPAFLASTCGTLALQDDISQNEFQPDTVLDEATQLWSSVTNVDAPTHSGRQKDWSRPLHQLQHQDLISSSSTFDKRRIASFSSAIGSAWIHAVPCSNLGLKLTNQQTRVAIATRLGAELCQPHTCICGTRVDKLGLHGLSCKRSAGRFARHNMINTTIKNCMGTLNLPAVLEPPGLSRSDGKRPDGLTLVPWERGMSLIWDATVVDALAPSRLAGINFRAGDAAGDAEIRKEAKYQDLVRAGYMFQPVAFETQGCCGESTSRFLKMLGKKIEAATFDPRASAYLQQRLSIAIQIGNCASILGTLATTDDLEELFYIV